MKAFEMIFVVNNLLWEICCSFSSTCIENLFLSQSITNKWPNWMEWPNWGQLVHYKQRGPRTKRRDYLLLYCWLFFFLITPSMHECILMVKNLLNSEILRANPEMTAPVCFSYFLFPIGNIVKSLTVILLSLPIHLCMCVYLISNFYTQRESFYYLNLHVLLHMHIRVCISHYFYAPYTPFL